MYTPCSLETFTASGRLTDTQHRSRHHLSNDQSHGSFGAANFVTSKSRIDRLLPVATKLTPEDRPRPNGDDRQWLLMGVPTEASARIADDLSPSGTRSSLAYALHARCPADLVETAFFDVEKQPQVIQSPLRLDGLARQLIKLVQIKWLS